MMTDDVGFAAAGTFGGPVPTPNLDRLAAQGLTYNRFHTTGICSPTRAALLTGRNHHAVGTGTVVELTSPYPGYTSRIPASAATVARILRDNGYSTAMFGKDHNVPNEERNLVGPFDNWPTGRGFEYFYGFVGGDSDQWRPAVYEGTTPVSTVDRDPGYLLDRELADRAINWLHNQQGAFPNKPFFMYYAPGTAHAPHQAPQDWIARFRGRFDGGWDTLRGDILARQKALGVVPPDADLPPRPAQIPAWDSLTDTERRVHARYMEVFAAVLAYQDAQFGRVLDELERMGIADDTLVVFIQGDNGASGEGGPHGTLNELAHLSSARGEHPVDIEWLAANLDVLGGPDTYQGFSVGWAYATSTPFPWVKQVASHLGGVRNPLVVSWPGRIERGGEVREQYHHVIDIVPTLLEAAGVSLPRAVDGIAQQPLDGTSMAYSFDAPAAASTRRTQYYEVLGNRAIYHDGWLANTTPRNMPWNIAKVGAGSDTSTYEWELYDLRADFSQAHDLAAEQPGKLDEMKRVFDREARRYNVYPVHDSGGMHRAMKLGGAGLMANLRPEYVYWGRDIRLSLAMSPPIFFLPFTLEAQIVVPAGGANGVLAAAGSHFGGWSFYLHDGRPVAMNAVSPLPGGRSQVVADGALSPGEHKLRFEFTPRGDGGDMIIVVDDNEVARGELTQRPRIMAGLGETFDTGRDTLVPVSTDYTDEGVFDGELKSVKVRIPMPGRGQKH
ncbi:MAG: arylsulfatase [Halioglobus sp.]|nr:arylsulfatase [Halioglobus sp.]